MSLTGTCQGCRQKVTLDRGDQGKLVRVTPCGCDQRPTGENPAVLADRRPPGSPQEARGGSGARTGDPRPAAATAPRASRAPGPPARGWSAAVRTRCSCGRTHPSRMESKVCASVRLEAAGSGGFVVHQVAVLLPGLGPKPAVKPTKKKPRGRPPGRPFDIRVDFLIAWPDGRWKLVEAKTPGRVSRDWPARAAALRTWYSRDPLFLGLEERSR